MMKSSIRLASFPVMLWIAGCGSVPNEVVPLRDGTLRAPTHVQADHYCEEKGSTMQPIGRAPGEPGVIFRCR